MVLPPIDTPRTEFAASTTNHGHQLADFSQSSIPSPTKERNDLVRGLRVRRGFEQRSPGSRPPFAERQNLPNGRPEFTPLLKSATRNRSAFVGKENLGVNGFKPTTPAGFRESYRSDLPDLPEHSSVLYEDETTSEQGKQGTPQLPQSSSSVIATPVPQLTKNGHGGLGEAQFGSLREQEARVEQLDKENFGLKLKIHYLEEAYRKTGKEFNDALVKQLTDLQVDKLTLQRDLKHYRKQLGLSQKELGNARKSGDESVNAELDRLREALAQKEEQLNTLQDSEHGSDNLRKQLQELRDQVSDLEHELRRKDEELDEKDDKIEGLKQSSVSSDEVENLQAQLEDRDEDIKGLQDALRTSSAEHERKLHEKDRALELKDDEVRDLEEELKSAGREESFAAKGQEIDGRQAEIDRLKSKLDSRASQAKQELDALKSQLELAERRASSTSREYQNELDDKDRRIQTLEQKISNNDDRSEDADKLRDQVSDLEADLRQKEHGIEQKEDEIDKLRSRVQQIENDSDEELMAAQDRIQELEVEQQRNLKDLQALRDVESKENGNRSQVFDDAQSRINELETTVNQARDAEKQLQREMHRLRDDIKHLENEIDDKETEVKDKAGAWDRQRSSLEIESRNAQEKIKSLEDAIRQLRASEGTLSGKEMALQKLLDDEKKQHLSTQVAIQKQLDEASKERDVLKTALQTSKDQLRDAQSQGKSSTQKQQALEDKVQSLEDEIDVLQATRDRDISQAKNDLAVARSETESSRQQLHELKQYIARICSKHVNAPKELTDTPEVMSPSTRQTRQRLSQLGFNAQSAAKLDAELKQVKQERQTLQRRLEEAEAGGRASSDDAATLVDQSPSRISPSCSNSQDSELKSLRSQMAALQEQRDQLEDDLDLLTSDLESVTSARDAAVNTLRDLRKQLTEATRAADHKYHSQVAEYERDIANLEDELSSAKATQREQEIKADSTNATTARLRKRLEGIENDLATSRARERTSSESPESTRRERRELQDAVRRAERKVDDLQAQLSDRDGKIESARTQHSDIQSQLQALQRDRRNATSRAEGLASELATLRTNAVDDTSLQKLRHRHGAELRGLAKQIRYLSAKCARSERLRQDAAFAKTYVGKVVEVYARVHRMDLRLVREMGVWVPLDEEFEVQRPRQLGDGVNATPRSAKKRCVSDHVAIVSRRREKRPTLKQVGLAMRAAVRVRRRAEEWKGCQREHESVLRKWRSSREERMGRRVG